MELALGTVQFGLKYGLRADMQPPENEKVRRILEVAFDKGIRLLDTAPVYGDIEARLSQLCAELDFRVITKIPAIPKSHNALAAGAWAVRSAQESRERLDKKMFGLLFHDVEDLSGPRGATIWAAVSRWAKSENIRLGVSGYSIECVRPMCASFPIDLVQLPGNALDQRINGAFTGLVSKPILHLRSAYLQGLLLLPVEEAVKLAPNAACAFGNWQRWLRSQGLLPIEGALSIVKSFEDVSAVVVGVENMFQLHQLLDAWNLVSPRRAAHLATDDIQLIDPRRWNRSS